MITDINSEDRLVKKTFADHLHDVHGSESIYAFNDEMFGPTGTLGRASQREVHSTVKLVYENRSEQLRAARDLFFAQLIIPEPPI